VPQVKLAPDVFGSECREVGRLVKGRYPDMLGLLLYFKKMFDDRNEDELIQAARPDSSEKSKR
jgi:hypothetical protein